MATPIETRTYRVTYHYPDGDWTQILVDGHDRDDAMSFSLKHGAEAVCAVEIPGSARPLGARRG